MDEEVKNKEGTDGRKRLITLAVMLLLLILSATSVLVFLLNVELKKAPTEGTSDTTLSADHGKDYYVPSFEIEEPLPSPDMLPQRRMLLTDELNLLMEGTASRVEETGDGSVQWIYDRTTPSALMTANFYVYLGAKGGTIWGRLLTGYIREIPVFANRIIVDVDGTVYGIDIQYNDLNQRYLDYIGETHEFVDLPIDNHLDILRHIGNAQDVFVCFRGEGQEHHFQLTRAQIDAVARMMRILRIREELDQDEKARAQR